MPHTLLSEYILWAYFIYLFWKFSSLPLTFVYEILMQFLTFPRLEFLKIYTANQNNFSENFSRERYIQLRYGIWTLRYGVSRPIILRGTQACANCYCVHI